MATKLIEPTYQFDGGLKVPQATDTTGLFLGASDSAGSVAWESLPRTLTPTEQAADYTANLGEMVLMTGVHTVSLPNSVGQIAVAALTGPVTVQMASIVYPGGITPTKLNVGGGLVSSVTVAAGTCIVFTYRGAGALYSGVGAVWYGLSNEYVANTTPPPARAHRQAGFTLNSWQKVAVDTKDFDPGGNMDIVNGGYVCPASGYYLVGAELNLLSGTSTGYVGVAIYKVSGGVAAPMSYGSIIDVNTPNGSQLNVTVGDVIQCNAGDRLELWGFSSISISTSTGPSGANYLSVAPLGTFGSPAPGQGIATQARAYRNAALTLTFSAWTKIPFDQVTYDPGSNFTTAGADGTATKGRYNCPVTGYYQVTASALLSVSGTPAYNEIVLTLNKNGVAIANSYDWRAVQTYEGAQLSDIVYCQAGDYLEITIYSTASVPLIGGAANTWFAVAQVAGANTVGALSPTAQSADYPVGPGQFVLMTGGHTVTLPAAPMAGSQVGVMGLTATVTVTRGGTDTINYSGVSGQTGITVPSGQTAILTYLGGVWYGGVQASTAPASQGIATQARGYPTGNTAIASGWVTIPLNASSFDPGGNIQSTKYVCPTTGYYQVEGNAAMSGAAPASGQVAAGILHNTTSGAVQGSSQYVASGAGNGTNLNVADIVYCQAGDTLCLQAYWPSVSSWSAAGAAPTATYFSVVQVAGSNVVGALSPTAQSADYTAGPGQSVLMTGAHTVTLPAAPQAGSQVEAVALTGTVTVQRGGGDTITNFGTAGATSMTVPAGTSASYRYLGGVWYVSAQNVAGILAIQRHLATNFGYIAVAYNNSTALNDGTGGTMTISYTPSVPVFWEVTGHVSIVVKTDAAYNYIYGYLILNVADQDGSQAAYHLVTQHSAVNVNEGRHVSRIFRLAAGTTYTASLVVGAGDGGTWQYYAAKDHLTLEGKVWKQ